MSPIKDDDGTASRSYDFSEMRVVIREVENGTRCEGCKNTCAGYEAHDWRKTCQSCKCPREAHAIYQEQATTVRERLGFKAEALTNGIDPRQLGYTWVPPGVMTSSKVQRYFDKIPQEKVPKQGTTGERYRERQITYQLPKQDLSLDYCKHVEPQHCASYEDFVAARNEIALDIGYIKDAPHPTKCATCEERIAQNDLAVIAPKFGDQVMWHPKCFTCATCDELLVDLTYCVHEDKLYCERHYAEMLKPRCNSCDEESNKLDEDSQNKNVSKPSEYASLQSFMAAERKASFDPTEITENACAESSSIIDNINDHRDDHHKIIESTIEFLQSESKQFDSGNLSEDPVESSQDFSSEVMDTTENSEEQSSGFYETITSTMETDMSPVAHVSDYFDDNSTQDGAQAVTHEEVQQPEIRSITPEPTRHVPTIQIAQSSFDKDDEMEVDEPVLQGLSDFYDFNASINPPRSRSASRSRSRSKTPGLPPLPPSRRSRSRSPSPAPKPKPKPLNFDDLEGVSDFLDFNVKLNRESYDPLNVFLYRNISQTADDFVVEQIRMKEPKGATKKNFDLKLNINNKAPIRRPGSPSLLSPIATPMTPSTAASSTTTPSTSRRRSSVFEREIEFIRQHQQSAFQHDECDDEYAEEEVYDEMSDEAYRFRRSRSQSRSMSDIYDMSGDEAAGGSGLQDRILAEIARTTINYQDFSKELNAAFCDQEQIAEDSMMMAQPEIVIQIDTNRRRYSCDDEEFLNRLEGEEYHHYRRYSLRQAYIEEEYPDDNEEYVFLQEIRHEKRSKSLSPGLSEMYDMPEDDQSLVSNDSDEVEHADDVDDSGSEDERQTVVGADDDIGGDVFNDGANGSIIQSDEESKGEVIYENGNLNEGDWKESGAVGGAETVVSYHSETSLQIEEIYNEVVENLEESQIETVYDDIFNQVKDEVTSPNAETETIKTDDILEEILNEPNEAADSSSLFLDHERLTANRKSPFGRRRSPFLKRSSKIVDKEGSPSLTKMSSVMANDSEMFIQNEKDSSNDQSSSGNRFSPSTSDFIQKEHSPSANRGSDERRDFEEIEVSHPAAELEKANSLERGPSPSTIKLQEPQAFRSEHRYSPSQTKEDSSTPDKTYDQIPENDKDENTTKSKFDETLTRRSSSIDKERSPSFTRNSPRHATSLETERTPSITRTTLGQSLDDIERSPSTGRTYSAQSAFLENERSPSANRTFSRQSAFLENERSPSATRTYLGHTLDNERSPSASRTSLSQTSFLENERSSPSGTTRTRLRTRYGLSGTSYAHGSYDYNESNIAPSDIAYEPKKEYNWRKNFRLDDDDNNTNGATNIPTVVTELTDADEDNDKEVEETLQADTNILDDRKFSLGGESITLYSRTPDRFNDFLPDAEPAPRLDDLIENDTFDQDEVMPILAKEESSNDAKDIRKDKKKKKNRKAFSLDSSEGYSEAAASADINNAVTEKTIEETPKKKSSSKAKRRKSVTIVEDESRAGALTSPKRKSPKRISPESSKAKKTSSKTKSNKCQEPVEATIQHNSSPNNTAATDIPAATSSSSSPANETAMNSADPTSPTPTDSTASAAASTSTSSTSQESETSTSTRNRPPLERKQSSGAYELIKDGSMYPWF